MSFNKVNTDGSITRVAGGTLYADAPVGAIIPYGGTTAPDGFLLCQGQAVNRTTYAELFKVIGTAFGAGDGSTTFNVPDLREATVKGVGENPNGESHIKSGGLSLGEFTDDRLQNHTHAIDLISGGSSYVNGSSFSTTGTTNADVTRWIKNNGRSGNTTEVKAVGVNYIIKATQVGAPADFAPVDVVENGNMKAVTSNAVAEALTREVRKGTSASVTISAGYFTSTVGIIFDSPMPDADYEVILYNTQGIGSQWSDFIPCVKNKTVSGFEVQFNTLGNTPVASGQTVTCNIAYTAFKL